MESQVVHWFWKNPASFWQKKGKTPFRVWQLVFNKARQARWQFRLLTEDRTAPTFSDPCPGEYHYLYRI